MTRLNPALLQTNLNWWMKFNYRRRIRKENWVRLWQTAHPLERNTLRFLLAPPYRTLRLK